MLLEEAISLIAPAISTNATTWADIGAGTGLFTQALSQLLVNGKIYAVDKNPHALWRLQVQDGVALEIVEANFDNPLPIPMVDGIIMANALHYSNNHKATLENVLSQLKPGGVFILIEYDLVQSPNRWIPFPIDSAQFEKLSVEVGLSAPQEIKRIPSNYGYQYIYSTYCQYFPQNPTP